MIAILVAFGLLVCSLAQMPAPWQQLQRLDAHGPQTFAQPLGQDLVAQHTRPGERVLVMSPLGHRIAENLRLDDVEPWSSVRSIFTLEQLEESLAALRAADGTKVFVMTGGYAYRGLTEALATTHRLVAEDEVGMQLWLPS